MKVGVALGQFLPPHKGSISVCKVAEISSDCLLIIIICTPTDPIASDIRTKWLRDEFPGASIKVLELNSDLTENSLLGAVIESKEKLFPTEKSHFFGFSRQKYNESKSKGGSSDT